MFIKTTRNVAYNTDYLSIISLDYGVYIEVEQVSKTSDYGTRITIDLKDIANKDEVLAFLGFTEDHTPPPIKPV